MRFRSTQVESAVLRRLKLLKRLQEVQLSPEAGLALMQRVETNSWSAEDREILIQVMRATQASQELVEVSPLPARKAKRKRQLMQAARRRNRREGWSRPSGHPRRWAGHDDDHRLLWLSRAVGSPKGCIVKKPPPRITLSAEEGEALIERVEGSGLSAEDRRVVVQVIRLYFWLMVALQEAKLSLKRFRTMLFGEPANARAPAVPAGAPGGAEVRKQPAASSGHGAPATPARAEIFYGRFF